MKTWETPPAGPRSTAERILAVGKAPWGVCRALAGDEKPIWVMTSSSPQIVPSDLRLSSKLCCDCGIFELWCDCGVHFSLKIAKSSRWFLGAHCTRESETWSGPVIWPPEQHIGVPGPYSKKNVHGK